MSLRSKTADLAASLPEGEAKSAILATLSRTAGRNGEATLKGLGGTKFTVYWRTTYSPHGLAAEQMPNTAKMVRANLERFVRDLSRAAYGESDALSLVSTHSLVLLDVDKSKGSIIFKLEGKVQAKGRKPFTSEDLAAAQPDLNRLGFTVKEW